MMAKTLAAKKAVHASVRARTAEGEGGREKGERERGERESVCVSEKEGRRERGRK